MYSKVIQIYILFFIFFSTLVWGFPDSSVGKESACNAGAPGSIPGSGRSAGEGIGYPLQYSWASLVDHLVKNLLRTQETWVQSFSWKDPLEKGKATHSSILAWKIPWGCKEVDMLSDFHFSIMVYYRILNIVSLFHYGLLQGIEHSSPCYTVGLYCLSTLYIYSSLYLLVPNS